MDKADFLFCSRFHFRIFKIHFLKVATAKPESFSCSLLSWIWFVRLLWGRERGVERGCLLTEFGIYRQPLKVGLAKILGSEQLLNDGGIMGSGVGAVGMPV